MAALDFPANPTNGQTYDNYQYDSSVGVWRSAGTKAGLTPRVSALEAYPSGLVPIVPTSVTVGSGSASVSAAGILTVSGASSVSLNGTFSGTFSRYKIVLDGYLSAVGWFQTRLRASGTDNTTTNYANTVRRFLNSTSSSQDNSGVNASYLAVFGVDSGANTITLEVQNPYASVRTNWVGESMTINAGTYERNAIGGVFNATTSFDGISFIPGNNFTGTVQVYGFRN